jgi:pimeloyl-ACP methyl ester carboxylesterase
MLEDRAVAGVLTSEAILRRIDDLVGMVGFLWAGYLEGVTPPSAIRGREKTLHLVMPSVQRFCNSVTYTRSISGATVLAEYSHPVFNGIGYNVSLMNSAGYCRSSHRSRRLSIMMGLIGGFMNWVFRPFGALAGLIVFATAFSPNTSAQPEMIVSRMSKVEGVDLHYLTAGHGPAVVLLHGYTQTSRMWRPIIPLLAAKFTVIAPDLPGIGDSEIPADGLDMKTAAIRIHALVKSLGVEKARVVGHDIGLMVAYAYAAQFPSETEKLVVMDAFLPGVSGWEDVYNSPSIWHFRFNGPTPEALVRGRERIYFDYFWNDFAADRMHSIPEADRAAYAAAYARKGRMRAGWAYFVSFQQAAKDFAQLSQTKLSMPVLAIGGEKANGQVLGEQMKIVATDATMIVLKNCGHWVLEEKPKETTDALMKLL